MQLLERLRKTAHNTYEDLNGASGGTLGIIRTTIEEFGKRDGSKWAAALAYYMFFSLFPLVLVMVGVATYVLNLDSQEAIQEAVSIITEAVPVSEGLVADNLDAVLELRGALTIAGVIGLIWSASSAFAVLSRSINAAFHMAETRGFVKQRLIALGMVIGVIVLLLLSFMFSTVLDLVPNLEILGIELNIMNGPLGLLISRGIPLIISFITFIVLYRWIPTEHVIWKAVLWGAGIAAVAWELAKWLFSWYIGSGLANYGLVYGSLSSVVILLFWIYVSSTLVLLGAHLAATLDPDVKTGSGEGDEAAEGTT